MYCLLIIQTHILGIGYGRRKCLCDNDNEDSIPGACGAWIVPASTVTMAQLLKLLPTVTWKNAALEGTTLVSATDNTMVQAFDKGEQ